MHGGFFGETRRALVQRWGIRPVPEADGDTNRQLLLDALEERVIDMIDRRFDKLQAALYRLDVPEARYKEALGQPDLRAKARALAEIILERETQKVESWLKYAEEQRRRAAAGEIEAGDNDKELPDAPE